MPALLTDLLSRPELELSVIVATVRPDTVVTWAHSTDLEDPTPFVSSGTLLLTTGTQFRPDAGTDFYDEYVSRLVSVGACGLGFGTEVSRSGAPEGLIASCERFGLLLFTVPYRVPFIAIARWVAQRQAQDERERAEWGLATQRAVSLAALGSGGIDAAMNRCRRELDCRIALFGADLGVLYSSAGHRPSDDSTAAAMEMLLAQRRSRREQTHADGSWIAMETLGPGRSLLGALVVERATPLDRHELSVIIGLLSLIEVHLSQRAAVRRTLQDLMDELFELLVAGSVDRVRRVVRTLPLRLPERDVIVYALEDVSARDGAEVFPSTFEAFVARRGGVVFVLVSREQQSAVQRHLQDTARRAGASTAARWDRIAVAAREAEIALAATATGQTLAYSDLAARRAVAITSAAISELARHRLAEVRSTSHGAALLADAEIWLAHNGQWQPASEQIGLHRHVLRRRMNELGDALGLMLDRFGDRVELWLLITAEAPPRV